MNLIKFNKAKCKVLHLVLSNPQYQYRLGNNGLRIENSPMKKDLWVQVDEKIGHEPAMCVCSQERKSYCWLNRNVATTRRSMVSFSMFSKIYDTLVLSYV